jgi:hypothetical protein
MYEFILPKEIAEKGLFSDQSGDHESEEYMSLYSQGTKDCREGSVL